ncbi:MAG: J domain-containing protein [Alphaproteobacteria bacterium]
MSKAYFDPIDDGPAPKIRICEHKGCEEQAMYPAPKGRSSLRQYYWFCLDHVREYNKKWNYYAGMDEDEIEHSRRVDITWQRPTWPIGKGPSKSFAKIFDQNFDPFSLFEDDHSPIQDNYQPSFAKNSDEAKALKVLQLDQPVTFSDIKQAYKALVKKFHPDANSGSKQAEERLKRIIIAFGVLKKSLGGK